MKIVNNLLHHLDTHRAQWDPPKCAEGVAGSAHPQLFVSSPGQLGRLQLTGA